ncbi:MAG: FAD binding domain-containing protein [Bacillota bacterium]
MRKDYLPKFQSRQKISGKDSNQFFAPQNIKEALEVLADKDKLEIIAGGTDIMVEKFEKLYDVKTWLALDNINELKEININDNNLEIGAGVTHSQLVNSKDIKENIPILKEAALDVGSPQIRNRGTIGGNIVTSSPAGDLLPVLLVYDAEFVLKSDNNERRVKAEDFFTGVKENLLKDNELLTKIIIKIPKNDYGKWKKIGKRKALVISSLSLALRIEFDKNCKKVKKAALAMGSVAPTPIKIKKVSEELEGKKYKEIEFEKIASIVENSISPIDDIRGTVAYRNNAAYNITLSALKEIEEKIEGC